jgi:hypothetical protein
MAKRKTDLDCKEETIDGTKRVFRKYHKRNQ